MGTKDSPLRWTAVIGKKAGIEQRDGRDPSRADIVQAWYNQAARQEPFFISHTKCRKPISRLMK